MKANSKNLDLQLPEGSDYVEITQITGNFEKIDAMAADYIIDTENNSKTTDSTVWRIRKWKSGFCECWGTYTTTAAGDSSQQVAVKMKYPLTYDSVPVAIANCTTAGYESCYVGYTEPTTNEFFVRVRNVPQGNTRDITVRAYIAGMIK